MKRTLFFSSREDIVSALNSFEKNGEFRYFRMGIFVTEHSENFNHGEDIPNIGKANSDSSVSCESFLILNRDKNIIYRRVADSEGIVRYVVDQLVNPDSISFTPAGSRNDEALLHGRIATISDSSESLILIKKFNKALKRDFIKIKAFLVGPEAVKFLNTGKRLTMSLGAPRDFDLAL